MKDSAISFQALQIANEQRSAYGLRYNDFVRYRKHCANRTHRLRSTLKLTHGKGREFRKPPFPTTDNIQDGHLQLLLLEAERAWAYSQDLVAQSTQPANESKVGTLRHSATGRFRRAVNWSAQLLSHCQSLYTSQRLSAENLLQATIYTLILNGRFLRHRDDFEDALIQLSVARSLLDELTDRAATSRDQALATLFADDIGPEIRYCAHELGRAKAYDVDGIVKELASQHKNDVVEGCTQLVDAFKAKGESSGAGGLRERLGALMWEGEPIPVRYPELVDVLLKVQEAEGRIREAQESGQVAAGSVDSEKEKAKQRKGHGSRRGVAAYDAVLLALSDAEGVARKIAETQQLTSGSSSSSAAGTRDIQFVHAYIVYQLLSRRIQRDLLLTAKLLNSRNQFSKSTPSADRNLDGPSSTVKKTQVDARLYPAVVKVLDTVVQSLTQMRNLSIVDESPDLAAAVEARLLFTRARRCQALAQCYIAVKKYAEALILIQHATIQLRESRSSLSISVSDPISSENVPFYPLTKSELDEMDSSLFGDGLAFKNDWFAYNGGSVDGDSKTYKKPLFFDIALNYVQMDMDRLQQRAGKALPTPTATAPSPGKNGLEKKPQVAKSRTEEVERALTPEPQAPQRGGLSNLLGGWWGRK